jgi:hypothetical protein
MTQPSSWVDIIHLNVAGYGHHAKFTADDAAANPSGIGKLDPDIANVFDTFALAVVPVTPGYSTTGQRIGYVPRAFSEIVSGFLRAGVPMRVKLLLPQNPKSSPTMILQTKKGT